VILAVFNATNVVTRKACIFHTFAVAAQVALETEGITRFQLGFNLLFKYTLSCSISNAR